MSGYLSQEDFFPDYFEGFDDGIEPSPENLEIVRGFLLEKWRERAAENGVPQPDLPVDLSDSCKFSALFGSVVFAADIAGRWDHVYNVVDGEVVDINAHAADIRGRPDIYRHDPAFIGSGDFRDSAASCVARVSRWIVEFGTVHANLIGGPADRYRGPQTVFGP
jgi:hypothetical protein